MALMIIVTARFQNPSHINLTVGNALEGERHYVRYPPPLMLQVGGNLTGYPWDAPQITLSSPKICANPTMPECIRG